MTYQPPDWVPETEWREFVKMRRTIRHPLTEYACELIVSDLAKFKAQGYEPGVVLRESIKNSWRGVFIPNGTKPTTPAISKKIFCNFCQGRFADFAKHECEEYRTFMEQQKAGQALKQRVAK